MDRFLIQLGYALILAAIAISVTAKADDPYSQGRVKQFSCPEGYTPADTDKDGYADTCYKEPSKRAECRRKARNYCLDGFSGWAYRRCLHVEYQACG